uniref:Epidermal patterning factor-like protein n=1 Tax=Aegilops tauschii subsp. strangulata TaxID=200361 RepID=A0A453BNM9_AEGTS
MIGSRPPRCERVCMSCGHCEAVQVPIVPQDHKQRAGREHHDAASDIGAAMLAAYRVNGGISDYKPLSWKCRCGGMILDP